VNGDQLTGSLTRAVGENVGSYAILQGALTAGGNYTINYTPAIMTITQASAWVTPTAASKTYGTSDPVLTGTWGGFLPADGVTATYSRAAGETVAGGSYAITATLSPSGVLSNYKITYNTAQFTITQRAASVTSNAASTTYGNADPVLSGVLSSFLPADNVTAAWTRTPGVYVNGGPYVVSATLSPTAALSNYNITYNAAAFTILPAPLTITVSPSSYLRAVGVANPTFTGIVVGTANNDLTTGKLVITYTTTAGTSSPIGSYPVTATLSGMAATSYLSTVVPGALTVGAQGIDLIESAVSRTGTPASGGTIEVTDTATNQGIKNAGGSMTYFYLSTTATGQGTYLGNRGVPALALNGSSTATTALTLPSGLMGTYYMVACANGGGQVSESNTANNCTGSAAFTVVGADLTESGVSATGALVNGGTIQVTDTVNDSIGARARRRCTAGCVDLASKYHKRSDVRKDRTSLLSPFRAAHFVTASETVACSEHSQKTYLHMTYLLLCKMLSKTPAANALRNPGQFTEEHMVAITIEKIPPLCKCTKKHKR
jgi:hypothetical protein